MTVVLIDGRSGSGKTELARVFVARHPEFQLVQLDDLYRGWDGLAGASADLPRLLAEGTWTSWDWAADAPGAARRIDPARPILVEGAGAISRASAPLADLRVWVDLPEDPRKRRALARDGETYAPHWDRWADQELAHIAREDPRALADVTVDGTDARAALAAIDRMLPRG